MAESKKSRKHGRNADWCKAYAARGQREKNKIKRVLGHIKRYGATDATAVHCYNNLPMATKPAEYRSIAVAPTKAKQIDPVRSMAGGVMAKKTA